MSDCLEQLPLLKLTASTILIHVNCYNTVVCSSFCSSTYFPQNNCFTEVAKDECNKLLCIWLKANVFSPQHSNIGKHGFFCQKEYKNIDMGETGKVFNDVVG